MKSTMYDIMYQRNYRKWAKENKVCPACRQQDEKTLSGRTYCEKCAARYRSYHYKKIERIQQ